LKSAFRFNDAVLRNLVLGRSAAVNQPSPMMSQNTQDDRETNSARERFTSDSADTEDEPAEEAVVG
jgi:small subunit ribosomal protein S6